ncbi:MAG: RNase adapter RapZ [Rhodospirillales bacterium]|nr:RNase adapter RapZ [Rhodospirillales bacterium]MSP79691.1 RNase adapter RapZ [Rhodospirillales bacterium]
MIKRAGLSPRARTTPRRVVLVTGISGAGKSSALKAFEDMGFETVDNAPLGLLEKLIAPAGRGRPQRPLAVGIDVRTRDFNVRGLLAALAKHAGKKAHLVFMDATDAVLQRRYAETRHRHPLAGSGTLGEGIRRERRLLRAARERADLVIDTSEIGPGELKHVLSGRFAAGAEGGMVVFVTSFAYRHGLPGEADMVFDVRFLRNPHYRPELKPRDGRDRAVAAYIGRDRHFAGFFRHLTQLVGPLLGRYAAEGKSYLTLAVGCTGGRHRSVFVAERLAQWLKKREIPVEIRHRDLETGAVAAHNRRPGRNRSRALRARKTVKRPKGRRQ